jgi:hypothetical protein
MVNGVTFGAKGAIFYCQNKKFTEKISEATGFKTAHLEIKMASKAQTGHNQKAKIILVRTVNTMKA